MSPAVSLEVTTPKKISVKVGRYLYVGCQCAGINYEDLPNPNKGQG